jgi:hypothetical protein
MRPLSATEALTPAWNHTRNLFATRPWKTVLKIGLIALLANLGSGLNTNYRSGQFKHLPGISPAIIGALVGFAVIIVIVSLVLAVVFFYLSSRFQFVFFEVVLRSDTTVAPAWRRYGPATWRWMGLKLLLGFIALVVLLPVLVPFGITIFHLVKAGNFHPHFWPMLKLFFGLILGFLAIGLVIWAASRLLHDFGLPSMALEATPVSETARRVLRLLGSEPGAVFLYLLIYFFTAIAFAMACFIIYAVVIIIAMIPLGLVGVALWFGLHHAGTLGYIFLGLGFGLLALIFLAVMLITMLILLAYQRTFLQAYALYFLAGRYPLLATYLEPPPPAPAVAALPTFVIP